MAVLEKLGFQHRALKATSHRRYAHLDGRAPLFRFIQDKI
jgi:predicted RNA binding protein YcfA (HicA-like mRNA interferase family)